MKFKFKTTYKSIVPLLLGVYIIIIPVFSLLYSMSPSTMHKIAVTSEYGIYAIFFLSSIFLSQTFSPIFFIQKSDVDFLFMLPIDEKKIVIAYTFSAFLMNLFASIFVVIFLFPVIYYSSLLVGLLVSIMYSLSFLAFKRKRKIVAPLITAWMLSSITKSPFTPFSMVYGYVYGYFILALLVVITVILGIKNASVEDLILEFYKREGLTPSKIITPVSLYTSSPFFAMLKRNLNFIEIGGIASGIPYIASRRMKMYKVITITTAIAIIIYILPYIPVETVLSTASRAIIVALVGFIIILLTSSSAFANEPLWLNLSVMTPIDYARKYLLAKTLSVFIVFLPISISLSLLNPWLSFGSLFIPLVYIYTASITVRFNRASVIDIRVVSLAVIMFVITVILIVLDAFFPIAGTIATLASTLPFLFSSGYWEKTFEKALTSV